jgi:hypothetical protein
MNATDKACAVATTKAACIFDDSCAWGDSKSECYGSAAGRAKVFKQLGSKTADQILAQTQACNKVTSKDACMAAPLAAPGAGSNATKSTMPPPAAGTASNATTPTVPLPAVAAGGPNATKSTSPASMAVAASSPPASASSGACAALPTLLLALLALLVALAAAL